MLLPSPIANESPIVKASPRVLFSDVGIRWPRGIEITSVVLSLLGGSLLALLLLVIGPVTLPIIFSVLFILPWLVRDAFRLFIWLIVTWPIFTLYVRIPLPGGIPDISYDRVLVLLLVSVVIIDALLSKRQLLKATLLDALIIVYVMAQIINRLFVIWFGGIGILDLNGFLDVILIPVTLYWMAKNLVPKADLKWLLFALLIVTFVVCLTGLYEQAVGVRVFKASLSLGGSEVSYQWQDSQGRLRAAGALANPAVYGAVVGMGCLAGLGCLSLVRAKLTRLAIVSIIGVLLYGVFASYTRSAWLSVFVVLFAAQFFVNDLWKKTLPILMLGLLFLVLIWNTLPNSAEIAQRAVNMKTITQRVDLNHIGWEKFLERPYLGWGSGALNNFGQRQVGIISHNTYLTFLVDGGLVLFLSFLAVVGYLLMMAIRVFRMTRKSSLERTVLVVMTGNVLIYLLSGLALELRFFGYFNALFWISMGLIDYLGARCDLMEVTSLELERA